MKTRILFVDDDPKILEGMRRSLRVYRNEWECEYAIGGYEALELLESHDFDVLVSDMRMPNMDGAQLLDEVKARRPNVIRIILSGQSEPERIIRAVDSTHAFLSKPCDPANLKDVIDKALKYSSRITDEKVKAFVSRLNKLPSAPASYQELLSALESGEPDIKEVAHILSSDVAMTAKVLHLANSAFFGLPQRVSDPEVAVMYLGSDTILALALSAHIFSANVSGPLAEDINVVMQHSIECSRLARKVAANHTDDVKVQMDALVAGMLHDSGLIVMLCGYPEFYQSFKKSYQTGCGDLVHYELETLGFDHAAVGAYLLGLWGLPDEVLQAVAFHHNPTKSLRGRFDALSAVYVAEAMSNKELKTIEGCIELDQSYVSLLGINLDSVNKTSIAAR